MDIEAIADSVLKQYNSEKEKNGKADFKKIISNHYRDGGIQSGVPYNQFFTEVSKKCHDIQPPSHTKKHVFSDNVFLFRDAVKRVRKENYDLGNGNEELGAEFANLYQFG